MKHIIGELRSIPDNVEETRTVQFVISTERRDRHKTVLSIDGWDLSDYERNGIVGYQHDVYSNSLFSTPNPDAVIGKGRAYPEGNQLIGEVVFEPFSINPLAEKIFRKVLFGTLKATSVGFLPVEDGHWGKDAESRTGSNPTYFYGKRQLLEFSIVNIPSNADAIVRGIEDKELKEIEEPQPVEQAVPDASEYMKMSIDLTN